MVAGVCPICGKWSHMGSPKRVTYKKLTWFFKYKIIDENLHVCDSCYVKHKPINHDGRSGKERRSGKDRRLR